MTGLRFLLVGLLALTGLSVQAVAQDDPVRVCTDYWPPFVNREGESLGTLARTVEMVLDNAGEEVDWAYFDYAYCRHRLLQGDERLLSFPWFETPEREANFALSEPLASVRTRVYYNRRFNSFPEIDPDLSGYTFGKVASYAYGDTIDPMVEEAIVFQTEDTAIQALLDNRIDLLPMTETVADAILQRDFPNQLQLIRPVEGTSGRAQLHVMAPKTDAGEALIADFDASLKQLRRDGILRSLDEEGVEEADAAAQLPAAPVSCQDGRARNADASARAGDGDLARIVSSEGFPVVLGRQESEDGDHFYALPQGATVFVVCWSQRIAVPSTSDRLYKTMVDESRVVILDGPHVGEELYIKNMHLQIVSR